MNISNPLKIELSPSLFELEQAIRFFTTSDSPTSIQLKQFEWLWGKIPQLGKILATFFSKKQFWKDRFLLPCLIDSSLSYMDRMKEGDYRRHEEESFFSIAAFLQKDSKATLLVAKKAKAEILDFLLKEIPSFQIKKDIFRSKCQKEKIYEENCAWYRNETFAQYLRRMEERLKCVPFEEEQRPKSIGLPERKSLPEKNEDKTLCEISGETKRAFRLMKENVLHVLFQTDEIRRQSKMLKHRSCLLRAEDENLYKESLLIEDCILNISISLEEMLSHSPEAAFSFESVSEDRAKNFLSQYEMDLAKAEKEIERIKFEIRSKGNDLTSLKKKINFILQALSKQICDVELLVSDNSYCDIQSRLISQAKHALDEYKKGLMKSPGLLFSIQKLGEYIEDIMELSLSFIEKGKLKK